LQCYSFQVLNSLAGGKVLVDSAKHKLNLDIGLDLRKNFISLQRKYALKNA
jgi:hypothetical protein